MEKGTSSTYKAAGVDITKAMGVLDLIKPLCGRTHDEHLISGIGPFGSVLNLSTLLGIPNLPHLVQSIDGPGTLPSLARQFYEETGDPKYFKIAGYLVAIHCFCDIGTSGAVPTTFQDNISSTNMDPKVYEAIVDGMAEACLESGCRLVGGECAQLPGIIVDGEYDFCGCVSGLVRQEEFINPINKIWPGNILLGIASSGMHLNGWSLMRDITFRQLGMSVSDIVDFSGKSVAETFITGQPNYASIVHRIIEKGVNINGNCHITGGGLYDNVERILRDDFRATIDSTVWTIPESFRWLVDNGNVEPEEAYRTWNMGVGWVMVLGKHDVDPVIDIIKQEFKLDAWAIGQIEQGEHEVEITF